MLRATMTGLAILALTAPAMVAPATAAPRAKAKKPPAVLDIHNQRTVALKGFSVSLPGDDGKLVGKLAKPVAAGGKSKIKLTGAKGCEYVARWEFEDAGDESTVDLCSDPKIVLTD